MQQTLEQDERQCWARNLYTTQRKSIADVALEVNVDEATVRQWIDGGAWDAVRQCYPASKANCLALLYDQMDKITIQAKEEKEPHTKNLEQFLKYSSNVKNLEQETNIGIIVHVAELFTNWLLRKDRSLTRKITLQFDAFIKHRVTTAEL